MQNEGIKKATELISFENLTPEERTKSKNKEAAKIVIATTKEEGKQERNIEIAKKMILADSKDDFIIQMTDLTLEQIARLRNEINQ